MKSWIILTVLAIVITAVATVAVPYLTTETSTGGPEFPAPPKQDGPAPKLVIDEDMVYKFTVLAQNTKGKHEWTFKNQGPGVLEVRGTATTCSCTTSDLFEAGGDGKTGKLVKIPPGESKAITVNWDTKKFEGNYRQFVTVATNDPERPKVELIVQGTVKQALVTFPADPSLSFLNVGNDEPAIRRIIVLSPDRPETKVTNMIVSNPTLLSAESRVMPFEEAQKYRFESGVFIEVTLKPTPTLGDFNEEVVVETDHPLKKSVTIKVKGKVIGPITVVPDKVEMREASASDGGSQDLTIWARGRSSVNFTVDKKPDGLDVAIEPIAGTPGAKGSKYKMTVKLAPGLESGRLDGDIVLKTDDPKASEIHVPVAILIQGAR